MKKFLSIGMSGLASIAFMSGTALASGSPEVDCLTDQGGYHVYFQLYRTDEEIGPALDRDHENDLYSTVDPGTEITVSVKNGRVSAHGVAEEDDIAVFSLPKSTQGALSELAMTKDKYLNSLFVSSTSRQHDAVSMQFLLVASNKKNYLTNKGEMKGLMTLIVDTVNDTIKQKIKLDKVAVTCTTDWG